MDISIDNIGFQGKREVYYGLQKAAKIAKTAELNKKGFITSRYAMTKSEERMAYNASVRAYLDMALRDEAFSKTIEELKSKELYALQEILKPEKTQYGLVNPMDTFTPVLNDVLNKLNEKNSVREAVSNLLKKLAL